MKVKVRKRKPAPVAAEQAPKAIYIVKRELNGKFGVPHHVEFDDYTAPAPVAEEQGSGGVYVPRVFIDYISGSANIKDIRRSIGLVKGRTFGQIKKKHNFFEEFCFKNNSTVKPQNLADLHDCRNARN